MRDQFDGSSEEPSFYGPLGSEAPEMATPEYWPEVNVESDEYDIGDDQEIDGVSALISANEDALPFDPPLSLEAVLKSTAPVLLITRPHQNANLIPPLLRVIARANSRDINLGAIAPLNRVTPAHGSQFLDACDAASLHIADPLSFAYFDSVPGRNPPHYRRWPYQQESTLSSTSDELWIGEVIQAQRDAGANIILSPGRFLPGNDPRHELDTAISQAELTIGALLPGELMATNITLSIHWLINSSLRDDLLARINEHAPGILYVRVLWNRIETAGQPRDIELLRGYRELCEVAQGEGTVVLFPDTDLTGWLTLAWGSRGFGTGIATSDRAFTSAGSGGGANVVPKERFLERSLLHTILRAEHQQLLSLARVPACQCTFCQMAQAGRPWSPEIQASHHVCSVAALCANTHRTSVRTQRDRWSTIVDSVDLARQLAKDIEQEIALDPGSEPKHLPTWQAALADS